MNGDVSSMQLAFALSNLDDSRAWEMPDSYKFRQEQNTTLGAAFFETETRHVELLRRTGCPCLLGLPSSLSLARPSSERGWANVAVARGSHSIDPGYQVSRDDMFS